MARIRARIDAARTIEDLQNVPRSMSVELAKELNALALELQARIRRGMSGTSRTGRTYTRGNVSHTASGAGNYPAVDTGRLINSVQIFQKATPRNLAATVGSDLVYARVLEFGNDRIPARPWLRRSLEAERSNINRGINEAINRGIRNR